MPGLPFDWRAARSLRDLEEKLTRFLISHHANSLDQLRDPDVLAEGVALEAAVTAERERLKLLATARGMAHLTKAHKQRKAQVAERSTKHRAEMIARVRRALAESRGNRSAAARISGLSKSTVDKWNAIIAAEDAARPTPTCALCGHPLPSYDGVTKHR
jgi:hypothetical protein